MFIDVQLLSGFNKPLTYKVPAHLGPLKPGMLVRVPIRTTESLAYVIAYYTTPKTTLFTLKECLGIEHFPEDQNYTPFIEKLAYYHAIDPVACIMRMRSFIEQKATEQLYEEKIGYEHKKITLTLEQQTIVDYITPHIINAAYTPTLIHGVTGSGKTEVYKRLIEETYTHNKTSIFLLPEVTLATQFERLLQYQLPHIPFVSFHSATSAKIKREAWQALHNQTPIVIIGVHLPILLPIKNLGLIIVDEEHDVGYQEKKHPKINTKTAALLRAQHYQIPIVLGSATPSIASLHAVHTGLWKLCTLNKRFSGTFPSIEHIILPEQHNKKHFWISISLQKAIKQRLEKKEQTIIFLNRRGLCFFLQCKDCAHIFQCIACSVSLTLHSDNILKCHYCSYQQSAPDHCPACKKSDFLKKGIGTQYIVTLLQKLFPTARIARADMDTTINKKIWNTTITHFEQGALDILVGTQTITKGYHFPNVTLVGIIWADSNLTFPAYNAKEVILQQLIQVAGRSGRAQKPGHVIIQSMTNSSIFSYLNEVQYPQFYEHEIINRQLIGYPPIIRFAEIELKHKKEAVVEQEAFLLASHLLHYPNVKILGPTQPPVSKIKHYFSRKLYIKSHNFHDIIQAYTAALKTVSLKSECYFTPNPMT